MPSPRLPEPRPLAAFDAPTAETTAFNAWLRPLLAAAPPPETFPAPLLRRARAEGQGVLPVDGPLEGPVWRPIPNAPAGGSGRVREVERAGASGVYLHLHGGGWTIGAPDQFDGRNLRFAEAANAHVIAAEYRLAPEHKWPACLEDCLAAAEHAIAVAASRRLPLVIGGESAGAQLACAVLLALRAAGRLGLVRAVSLNYGCYDLRMTPSMRNWGPENLVLSTPLVAWFIAGLLPDAKTADDPAASPLLADLSDMPPALLQVGTMDPLLDDTLFLAERWRAAGRSAELVVWPGAIHAFDYFDRPDFALPIALEAQALQADWVRRRFAEAVDAASG